ncbi:MAG TPA: P-loop NTPase [Candidatus Dormibacteraeota bacterium]|nr:P-loop NTPase [Candidatus Dormibacteraeota bacterium]
MLAPDDSAAGSGENPREGGRIVAVYSGKGGIGVSSICINLASVLASEHRLNVVAVDMDLQYGDLAEMITTADEYPSLTDIVVAPVEEMDADFVATAMVQGPGGFKLIACPPRPELSELVTAPHVTRLMSLLRERFDVTIVDCGGHLADPTTAVTDVADLILLVTSATTASLKNLRLALKLFEQLGVPASRLKVVLNHPDEHSDFADTEVVSNLGHGIAISLPHDSRTAVTAIDSGEPFVFTRPKSPLAAGLRRLAADVSGRTEPGADDHRGLRRMLYR